MSNDDSGMRQSSTEFIEEVMEDIRKSIRNNARNIEWGAGPEGERIVKGRLTLWYKTPLPDDIQSAIEEGCKATRELAGYTKVIVKGRRLCIVFSALKH